MCQVLRAVISQELNMLGNKMRLYADIALPGEKFRERAVRLEDLDRLESLMEHFTNYSQILCETMEELKKKAAVLSENPGKGKPLIPLYKRGQGNAGIHKDVI